MWSTPSAHGEVARLRRSLNEARRLCSGLPGVEEVEGEVRGRCRRVRRLIKSVWEIRGEILEAPSHVKGLIIVAGMAVLFSSLAVSPLGFILALILLGFLLPLSDLAEGLVSLGLNAFRLYAKADDLCGLLRGVRDELRGLGKAKALDPEVAQALCLSVASEAVDRALEAEARGDLEGAALAYNDALKGVERLSRLLDEVGGVYASCRRGVVFDGRDGERFRRLYNRVSLTFTTSWLRRLGRLAREVEEEAGRGLRRLEEVKAMLEEVKEVLGHAASLASEASRALARRDVETAKSLLAEVEEVLGDEGRREAYAILGVSLPLALLEHKRAQLLDVVGSRPPLPPKPPQVQPPHPPPIPPSAPQPPLPPTPQPTPPRELAAMPIKAGMEAVEELEGLLVELEGYRLLEVVGVGGTSVVYRAVREQDGLVVAVKVPRLEVYETIEEEFIREFTREAEVWRRLEHPYIVRVLDYGMKPIPFIVMEYCDGGNLRRRLREARGPLPLVEALRVGVQVADALSYAHHMGVVHRDLKPENVLFTAKGVAKITDFGIAKVLLDASTRTSTRVFKGTLLYAAPEQLDPETYGSVDWRTDVWQYGCLLYEMLAGRPPFQADTPARIIHMILFKEPEPPSALNPEVPRVLDEAVLKCLAKRREDRWRSIDLVLERLEDLLRAHSGRR